jgi:hypothetical protein
MHPLISLCSWQIYLEFHQNSSTTGNCQTPQNKSFTLFQLLLKLRQGSIVSRQLIIFASR